MNGLNEETTQRRDITLSVSENMRTRLCFCAAANTVFKD